MIDTELELPQGWVVCKLEDVAMSINSGFASGKHNKSEKGIPHIRPMNIDISGNIDLSVVKYVEDNFKDKLQKNDVLFNNTNSPKLLGKTTLIKKNTLWGYSNHMTRIRFDVSKVEPSWFSIFLHKLFLDGYYPQIAKNHVNQSSVNSTDLATKIPIIVAPLNEQKRIVSKIEELFSRIDSAKQSLEHTKLQLEQYRASLLKSAFEGKLTEKWREETNPIINERELQSWKDQRVEQYDEGCKLSKNTNKPKLSEFKILMSKDIPESWISTTIEGVASFVIDCPHSTPKFVVNGQYCIDTTCIKNSKINWNKIRSVSPKSFDERTLRMPLLENDIIFSREGVVGTSVLVPKDIDLCLGQRVMMFRFPKFFNAKFAELFLQSIIFKQQYLPLIAGSTVPHLNVGDVRKFNVFIPTIQEQEQIISQIEQSFSLIENTSQIVNSTLQNLQTMKMSVLKQAFEGKLVPQDPNDEPASVLLEKIKLKN